MELILKFETRELQIFKDKTYYNHVCHKLKTPRFGTTHIYEIYDDVSNCPFYKFGVFEEGRFKTLFTGEGDPIPEGKETTGGVWVEILIHYEDKTFKLK